jgi:hypothetical protein
MVSLRSENTSLNAPVQNPKQGRGRSTAEEQNGAHQNACQASKLISFMNVTTIIQNSDCGTYLIMGYVYHTMVEVI